jgi:hypothetical protein
MNYLGFDVSKDVFDVSFPDGKHSQFSNNLKGYQKFLLQLIVSVSFTSPRLNTHSEAHLNANWFPFKSARFP